MDFDLEVLLYGPSCFSLLHTFSLSLLPLFPSWFNSQRSHYNFLLDNDQKAHGIFSLSFFGQHHCSTPPRLYALLLLLAFTCPCASLIHGWVPTSLPKKTLYDLRNGLIHQSLGFLSKYRKSHSRSPHLASRRRVKWSFLTDNTQYYPTRRHKGSIILRPKRLSIACVTATAEHSASSRYRHGRCGLFDRERGRIRPIYTRNGSFATADYAAI
jgi:hypothetical protein